MYVVHTYEHTSTPVHVHNYTHMYMYEHLYYVVNENMCIHLLVTPVSISLFLSLWVTNSK